MKYETLLFKCFVNIKLETFTSQIELSGDEIMLSYKIEHILYNQELTELAKLTELTTSCKSLP